jgi:hypothetical protein
MGKHIKANQTQLRKLDLAAHIMLDLWISMIWAGWVMNEFLQLDNQYDDRMRPDAELENDAEAQIRAVASQRLGHRHCHRCFFSWPYTLSQYVPFRVLNTLYRWTQSYFDA